MKRILIIIALMCVVSTLQAATLIPMVNKTVMPTPTCTATTTQIVSKLMTVTPTHLTIKLKMCNLIKNGKGVKPVLPTFIKEYVQTLYYIYVDADDQIKSKNTDITCVYIYAVMYPDRADTKTKQSKFLEQCKNNNIQVVKGFTFEVLGVKK